MGIVEKPKYHQEMYLCFVLTVQVPDKHAVPWRKHWETPFSVCQALPLYVGQMLHMGNHHSLSVPLSEFFAIAKEIAMMLSVGVSLTGTTHVGCGPREGGGP